MRKPRTGQLALSIACLCFGLYLYGTDYWCVYPWGSDVWCVDIHEYSTILSILFIVIGALFGRLAFDKKAMPNITPLICPKCDATYMRGEFGQELACKQCGTRLELLKGFYDRHPELRDRQDSKQEK
ncbi:MAG: hypothetical protein AB7E47_15240 [Desulfovibrionaceae bacterium]